MQEAAQGPWVPVGPGEFRDTFKEKHLRSGKPKGVYQNVMFVVETNGEVVGDCGVEVRGKVVARLIYEKLLL